MLAIALVSEDTRGERRVSSEFRARACVLPAGFFVFVAEMRDQWPHSYDLLPSGHHLTF